MDIIKEIDKFEKECNKHEYTDTEMAWCLLERIRDFIAMTNNEARCPKPDHDVALICPICAELI